MFPHLQSFLAHLEDAGELQRVRCEVSPMLEISELKAGRTTGTVTMKLTIHNQAGVLVCDGEHKYLVRKRPQ